MVDDPKHSGDEAGAAVKTRHPLVRLLWLALALGLLVWLLNRIGWHTIGQSFVRVGVWGAALVIALGFLEMVLDTAALKAASDHRIGLLRLISYNGAGAIVNVIIPWEAGEVIKGTLMHRHLPTSEAIRGTLIWNYLFKLTKPAVALLAALAAWTVGHDIDATIAMLVLAACAISFLPYLLIKLLIHQGVAGVAVRVLRVTRIIRRDPADLIASAREFDARVQHFWREHPMDFARVLLYQAGARVSSWMSWCAAIWLVGLDYSLGTMSMVYAGITVASYVVLLVPVRIGVGEGAAYLLFALLGLDPAMGLIVAVILRIKALVANGSVAVFAAIEKT